MIKEKLSIFKDDIFFCGTKEFSQPFLDEVITVNGSFNLLLNKILKPLNSSRNNHFSCTGAFSSRISCLSHALGVNPSYKGNNSLEFILSRQII